MSDLDGRLIVLLLWGGGTVGAFAQVLINRVRSWRLHRDVRARRDLLEAIGLFAVAIASAGSIAFLLFGSMGTGLRGVSVAVSLGAFLAVGIFMAQERPQDPPL